MSWLRIAAIVTALAAPAVAPAVAHATVTGSDITTWTSLNPMTSNNPYLISFDNDPTTLSVSGTAAASNGDRVDIVCYFGSSSNLQDAVLESGVTVTNGKFSATNQRLQNIAGHACRLRAVPTGAEGASDNGDFAGPDVAVSEAALPVAAISGTGLNSGAPYNDYVNDVTFTGYAAWGSPGITPATNEVGCGGPFAAPVDSDFDVGNFAIDCTGSLLSNDLGAFGGRSEVQIDGHNAYDPGSAQALFAATGGHAASQNLPAFPNDLTTHVTWDPTSGLLTSQSDELWVQCNGPNEQIQTFATCPSFVASGVELQRTITTSDGGRVVTMTDTWSSTDGKAHSLDLLYDDYDGIYGAATGDRGYQFPGQAGFSEFGPGTDVPGPNSAPGSILVRTNVTAPDGSPSEAVGAITFGTAPSEFRFVSNNEFEEHNVIVVPAGGTATLSYVYSVGYSVSDVDQLALAAQDRFEPPSVVIGPPAGGTTASTASTTLSGIVSAGSGIKSLAVDGQAVPIGSDGTWSAQVPLSSGTNMITAVATDGAGATAQAQVAVAYNPPPPPPVVMCKVPKTRGMKLNAAEKALRRAHCQVGKVKRQKSPAVHSGRVTSTIPHAGRVLNAGTKIKLFVSKGR
jgi:hypothetical protein